MDADDPIPASGPAGVSQALLQAAALGEPRAVRALLTIVAPEVARVCAAVLGRSAADVDDATQESLLALLKALPRYRGECSLVRYANRIAVRTSLHHRRRELGKRRREAEAFDPALDGPAPAPLPDNRVLSTSRASLLQQLLAELPPGQAETLALRVVLGCSLRETADATDVPINTVRSRLRLARQTLRQRLIDDENLLWEVEDP